MCGEIELWQSEPGFFRRFETAGKRDLGFFLAAFRTKTR